MGQVGAVLSPEQIAESILKPNASISQGFATVQVTTKDKKTHTVIPRGASTRPPARRSDRNRAPIPFFMLSSDEQTRHAGQPCRCSSKRASELPRENLAIGVPEGS